jgi:putative oxidoreductase
MFLAAADPQEPEMQTTSSDVALLLSRIAFAALFVPAGLRKLMDLASFTASLQKQGVPYADVLAPVGAGIEFIGGIALAIGFQTRLAAVLLLLFTIIATLIAHRFWEFEGQARQMQQGQFFKNVAILGGFLALCVAGSGRYTVGRLWRRDREAGVPHGGDVRQSLDFSHPDARKRP